jgi:hypothetical protein
VLADLAVVIADGGDALAHLATLRDQDKLFGTAYRAFWQLTARGHNPDHVLLTHGKDPAELLQTRGPAALRAALDNASCLADHVITMHTMSQADHLDTVEGRIAALRRVAQVIVALPPDRWTDRAQALSDQLGVSLSVVVNEIIDASRTWDEDPHAQARSHLSDRLPALPPPVPAPAPAGDPAIRWTTLADTVADGLTTDPDWPTLANHLARAAATGFNVHSRLPLLAAGKPLDPQHRARDLDLRLIDAWPGCLPRPDLETVHDNRCEAAAAAHARLHAADRLHDNKAVHSPTTPNPPLHPEQPVRQQVTPPAVPPPLPQDRRQGPHR